MLLHKLAARRNTVSGGIHERRNNILCAVYEDKVYLSNAEGEKTEYSYIALYDFVKGDITGVKKYKSMWG